MKLMERFRYQRGQSLIEILIAMGILGVMFPAIFSGFITTRQGRVQQSQRLDATHLIQEAIEAARTVRESGWNNIAQNGTFYPEKYNNSWRLVAGTETINNLSRQMVISDVRRDATGQIVQSGGSIDPSTKRIDITIGWTIPSPSSVTASIYLTRYLDNVAYEETLVADFERGERFGTAIVNEAGGEVILGSGGTGDWCHPETSLVGERDLPKNGVANAVSAREGRVLVGTGENASGVSLAEIEVTNTQPPVLSTIATFDGYKTNDVFTMPGYALIGTDTNNREVSIVNTSNISGGKFTEAGYFDPSGNIRGTSVFVSNNRGYMTSGSNGLYVFDMSSISGTSSQPQLGFISLPSNGQKVMVVGDYAYVALAGSVELAVINVSNPANMSIVATADVNGNGGVDVYVNSSGTRAYLITNNSTTQHEFFIINIENKSGSLPTVSSYNTNAMNPKAVTVVPGNRAIIGGHNGEQYQVLNIVNETAPVRCGGLTFAGFNVNGLEAVLEADGDAYVYILTTDSNNELKVVRGGPGGQTLDGGEFISGVFDPGAPTVFNRFTTDFVLVNQTNMQFQIAVADPVAGSCENADYVFVGPDGTDQTFYGTQGVIPYDDDGVGFENPGRCFKYRAIFSTNDITWTPILHSIRVNYAP